MKQKEHYREGRTGVPPVEADIAGERAAVQKGRDDAETERLNPNREIEIARHPEDALGVRAKKQRLKHLKITKDEMIAVLVDEPPGWCLAKILSVLPDDEIKVHYWGNGVPGHYGRLFPLEDKVQKFLNT